MTDPAAAIRLLLDQQYARQLRHAEHEWLAATTAKAAADRKARWLKQAEESLRRSVGELQKSTMG